MTCLQHHRVKHMSKMIQIRHLPDAVYRTLKIRAVEQSTTLSEYLVKELTRLANTPSLNEWLVRVHQRDEVAVREDSAAAVRSERAGR